jgi:hypothetical protein
MVLFCSSNYLEGIPAAAREFFLRRSEYMSTVPPQKQEPSETDPDFSLWSHVRESLMVLPAHFASETNIEGLRATDIHTLNTALGATIEEQVVASLNRMRNVWDPDNRYPLYSFVRQTQTFPDVLFARRDPDQPRAMDIKLGIELKGWYVLAKEGEPSFRYQVTPAACGPLDMIVVVPWYLSNILAGTPKVGTPYIESARYAAEYRNYWWTTMRSSKSKTGINSPKNVGPYPKKSDQISDKPVSDSGGNFGRYARTGIMDDYIKFIDDEQIRGIPTHYWRTFFKMFQEKEDTTQIEAALKRLETAARETQSNPDLAIDLGQLVRLLSSE